MSPTTTRDTAVSTSLCFAIENWSYGWVSKSVKVIAALAVAPITAGWRRVTPEAVMTTTRAIATMTLLWSERNGIQRTDTPAETAAPAPKAATAGHTLCHAPSAQARGGRREARGSGVTSLRLVSPTTCEYTNVAFSSRA
jgi:hypothetical protein